MLNFFNKKKENDVIGEELIEALRCFLGNEGISFFQKAYEKHGTLNAVEHRENGIPHSIHFREGMQVRNFMRTFHRSKGILDWTDHDYDNRWEEAALRACNIKSDCVMLEKRREEDVKNDDADDGWPF